MSICECLYHHTTEHPRKGESHTVQCVLYNGNHPANYKGCHIYKELQQKLFLALRKKEVLVTTEEPNIEKQTLPTASYATMQQGSRLTTPKSRDLSKAMQKLNLQHLYSGDPTLWPADRNNCLMTLPFFCKQLILPHQNLDFTSDYSPVKLTL